jgi:putative colanic acid biosynthesis UDP-glucose lipid carrier transferase
MRGTNTVSIQKKPISDWNIFIKALEDYVFAGLSLIIFLPAMAVIAVLIKLDSKGPVFFRQRRHGLNHKVIEVLKFRTMSVLEDGETIKQATKSDSRITRAGRFLRRSSLDELPQLFNVWAGDMSLVGPRPHALAHNNYYSEMLENYARRHSVKPGITGWAQVNGLRGETTEPGLMEERVRYDLEYIDNWSIWLDLQILFMTPLFGFLSRRAY